MNAALGTGAVVLGLVSALCGIVTIATGLARKLTWSLPGLFSGSSIRWTTRTPGCGLKPRAAGGDRNPFTRAGASTGLPAASSR